MSQRTCAGCGTPLAPNRARGRERKWCSERCRKAQYSTPCERCGAPTDGSGGHSPHASRVCAACNGVLAAERSKARSAAHRARIERLWAEGKTIRQVCEAIGQPYRPTTVSVWRARGYNLPHRRTPEQRARITAGSAERLAKARAVWAERRKTAA